MLCLIQIASVVVFQFPRFRIATCQFAVNVGEWYIMALLIWSVHCLERGNHVE